MSWCFVRNRTCNQVPKTLGSLTSKRCLVRARSQGDYAAKKIYFLAKAAGRWEKKRERKNLFRVSHLLRTEAPRPSQKAKNAATVNLKKRRHGKNWLSDQRTGKRHGNVKVFRFVYEGKQRACTRTNIWVRTKAERSNAERVTLRVIDQLVSVLLMKVFCVVSGW